jgi:hypothetical protein
MGEYGIVPSGGFGDRTHEVFKYYITFNLVFKDRIDTSYGKIKVSIYGDQSKDAIVTFHDLGMDGAFIYL